MLFVGLVGMNDIDEECVAFVQIGGTVAAFEVERCRIQSCITVQYIIVVVLIRFVNDIRGYR